jgi:hypothetical protein
MPDRIAEIRARIGDSAPITIHGPEPLVRAFEQKDADIAYLLDEVDALRERVVILRAEVADLEDMADVRGGDA